jgi:hypothetical protein
MDVHLIGVHLIGAHLMGRACYGRLISIVAITGIVIERVKGRVRDVDWLWWIIIICEGLLDFRSWDVALF